METNEVKETKKIAIKGVIVEASHGKKFDEEEPYYRVSLQIPEETRKQVAEVVAPYLEGVDKDYIPNWVKGESEYINIKSKFPAKVLYKEKREEHVIGEFEDLAGSEGLVLATVKDGGIYLSGLIVEKWKKKSLVNFFDDKDSMIFQ